MAIKPENQELSYEDLVEVLRSLALDGRTGTVFILTDSKHYARIGLKSGRIAICIFGKYKGQEALPHIRRIRSGRYSFSEGIVSNSPELPLPPTPDVLRLLSEPLFGADGDSPIPTTLAQSLADRRMAEEAGTATAAPEIPEPLRGILAPGAIPPMESSAHAAKRLSVEPPLRLRGQALYETVTRELAIQLGPMARMLAANHERELAAATDLEQARAALSRLAGELGDRRQAEEFTERILERLSR